MNDKWPRTIERLRQLCVMPDMPPAVFNRTIKAQISAANVLRQARAPYQKRRAKKKRMRARQAKRALVTGKGHGQYVNDEPIGPLPTQRARAQSRRTGGLQVPKIQCKHCGRMVSPGHANCTVPRAYQTAVSAGESTTTARSSVSTLVAAGGGPVPELMEAFRATMSNHGGAATATVHAPASSDDIEDENEDENVGGETIEFTTVNLADRISAIESDIDIDDDEEDNSTESNESEGDDDEEDDGMLDGVNGIKSLKLLDGTDMELLITAAHETD
jgi:hypothetical protein